MAALVPKIILMLILLAGSAFFSGSETAFINLSPRQIRLFDKSEHKLQKLVASLMGKRRKLLNCFLLGNMTVNVLFYAVSSVLIIRLKDYGSLAAALAALLSFVAGLLFRDILPKSLAYAHSKNFCVAAALPPSPCL